jgi:hypothetical protein
VSIRAVLILLTCVVFGVALFSYVHSRPYMIETPEWTIEFSRVRGSSDKIGLSRNGDWLLYCSVKNKGNSWDIGTSDGPFGLYRCRETWRQHGLFFYFMRKVSK